MVKTNGGYQTCTSGSEAWQHHIVFLVMSFKRKTLHLIYFGTTKYSVYPYKILTATHTAQFPGFIS
jgi:hypothetical protein